MEALDITREIYEKAGLKRTFYKTKDGLGFYIHPADKNKAFLKIGRKRFGIFVGNLIHNSIGIENAVKNCLINNDSELAEIIKKENQNGT